MVITVVILFYNTEWQQYYGMAINFTMVKSFITLATFYVIHTNNGFYIFILEIFTFICQKYF